LKLENKDRIIKALQEHKALTKNLDVLVKLSSKIEDGKAPIHIQEFTDGSGLKTEECYLNGNYNVEMNTELVEAVIAIHIKYRNKLEEEIETL